MKKILALLFVMGLLDVSAAARAEAGYLWDNPTRIYLIGFYSEGTCFVESIPATSRWEALSYAKDFCPDCEVADLTDARFGGLAKTYGRYETPRAIYEKERAFCDLEGR